MSFHLHNAAFVNDLGALTRDLGRKAFGRKTPTALYHYTRESALRSIIQNRQLWAVCLTEQGDLTELTHGINLVEDLIMKILDHERCPFTQRVLAGIPEVLRSRKPYVFITCFCGSATSDFHWNNYGEYCLDSEPPSARPTFKCLDSQSEIWYSPVIYGNRAQRATSKRFLQGLRYLIKVHTHGNPERLALDWMAKDVARNAAQCLLTIAACFKRSRFRRDAEWRLLVCPKLALGSSAPSMADEVFASAVKLDKCRHVCLEIEEAHPFGHATGSPRLPFRRITFHSSLVKPESTVRIRSALTRWGMEGLLAPVPAHVPWWHRVMGARGPQQ